MTTHEIWHLTIGSHPTAVTVMTVAKCCCSQYQQLHYSSAADEWGRHSEIMQQMALWAMEMCSPPRASEWEGNEADAAIDWLCRLLCYAYTDKMTTARPGLELDFGLNVVRNKSVTQFDWTVCCVNWSRSPILLITDFIDRLGSLQQCCDWLRSWSRSSTAVVITAFKIIKQ